MIDLSKYCKIGEIDGFEIFKMKNREAYAAKEAGKDPFKILRAEAEGKEPIRRKEN
ncbi:hypothetical protein SAMN05216391_10867 [Lachnospiraceae bacterium KHCPX20]|nr:hypothetical protein SAMN05216391_10867 [Lachnospiraceae bacterium KHCPX20]